MKNAKLKPIKIETDCNPNYIVTIADGRWTNVFSSTSPSTLKKIEQT